MGDVSTLRELVGELAAELGQPPASVLGLPVAIDLRVVAIGHGQFVSGVPEDLVARVHDAFDGASTELTKLERAERAPRARFAQVAGELETALGKVPDAGVLLAALDDEPAACRALLDDLADGRRLVGRFLLDAGDEFDDERIDQLGDGYVRAAERWSALAAESGPRARARHPRARTGVPGVDAGRVRAPDPLRVLIDVADSDDVMTDGRVVVITGASKGIGRAMARGFGRDGARVVVASRDQGRCDVVADELRAEGVTALAVAAHMGNPEEIDALVDTTLQEFGRIDVVVNNAATNPVVAPLLDFPDELVTKLFAVNVIGPLRLARPRGARTWRNAGGGAILNIASRSASAPEPQLAPYAATKAALITLSKAMALEWADLGVRVNTIAPGPFATEMVAGLFEQDDYRDRDARLDGPAPHRRPRRDRRRRAVPHRPRRRLHHRRGPHRRRRHAPLTRRVLASRGCSDGPHRRQNPDQRGRWGHSAISGMP